MTNECAYKTISKHIFLASRSYSDEYEPVVILADCRDAAMEKAKKHFNTNFERGIRLESLADTNSAQVYEIK